MSETIPRDLRLVLLAALAYLHRRDLGDDPELMDAEIDRQGLDTLARAIDAVGERYSIDAGR